MVLTLSILLSVGQKWYFNYSCGCGKASEWLISASFDPAPEIVCLKKTLKGQGVKAPPTNIFLGVYIYKVISTEICIFVGSYHH